MLKEFPTDAVVLFEHDIESCGCHFETKVSILKNFPENVLCPACLDKVVEHKTEAIKELGEILEKYIAAKARLESDFNLKIIDGPIRFNS